MSKEYQGSILKLQIHHSKVKRDDRYLRLQRIKDAKSKIRQRALEILMVPRCSLKRELFFLSEKSLISLSYSEFNHEKILGEIPASFMSYSHKMGQVSYDFTNKYVQVQMELIQSQRIPIDYVRELYGNFNVDITMRTKALNLVDVIYQDEWQITDNVTQSLHEKTWIDNFIGNEQCPAQLQRISIIDNKPQFEFFYNYNYMMLIGVLPNILIDVLLQTQQLPEIAISTDLQRWVDLAEGVVTSQENPVIIQNEALIITYEGMKLGCTITESNFHTYSKEKQCHQYIRKITYQLTNPSANQYVFDMERIRQNSLVYLQENQIFTKNARMDHQLLSDTYTNMQTKYKITEPCGFKLKISN